MREMQDAWRNLLVSAAAIALYRFWEEILGPQEAPGQGSLLILTACVVLFLVTFFRFLRGDETYLEQRYKVDSRASVSGIGKGFDVLSLLVHGGIFTGLGLSANQPEIFIRLYAFLLATNSLWLWLNLRKETVKKRLRLGGQEGVWMSWSVEQDAAWLWIRNNLATTVLLVALEVGRLLGLISEPLWLVLSLAACYLNCFVDLAFAWPFYFPRPRRK